VQVFLKFKSGREDGKFRIVDFGFLISDFAGPTISKINNKQSAMRYPLSAELLQ